MKRTGMGKGLGKGYKNIAPMDSHIHSLSAKGVKTRYAIVNLNVWSDDKPQDIINYFQKKVIQKSPKKFSTIELQDTFYDVPKFIDLKSLEPNQKKAKEIGLKGDNHFSANYIFQGKFKNDEEFKKNIKKVIDNPKIATSDIDEVEIFELDAKGNVPKGWSKTLEGKNESWYEYKSNSSYNGNLRLVIKKRNNIKPKYNVQIEILQYLHLCKEEDSHVFLKE